MSRINITPTDTGPLFGGPSEKKGVKKRKGALDFRKTLLLDKNHPVNKRSLINRLKAEDDSVKLKKGKFFGYGGSSDKKVFNEFTRIFTIAPPSVPKAVFKKEDSRSLDYQNPSNQDRNIHSLSCKETFSSFQSSSEEVVWAKKIPIKPESSDVSSSRASDSSESVCGMAEDAGEEVVWAKKIPIKPESSDVSSSRASDSSESVCGMAEDEGEDVVWAKKIPIKPESNASSSDSSSIEIQVDLPKRLAGREKFNQLISFVDPDSREFVCGLAEDESEDDRLLYQLKDFVAEYGASHHPLVNRSQFLLSILKEDHFYLNTILPSLKILAHLITPSNENPQHYYQKWVEQLSDVAELWKQSGSDKSKIDDLYNNAIPIPRLYSILKLCKRSLDLTALTGINLRSILLELSTLDISDSLNVQLQALPNQVEDLLINYFDSQKDTDFSSVFESTSVLQKWPRDCQFLLLISLHLMEKYLINVETNYTSQERNKVIRQLEQFLKQKPPKALMFGLGLLKSSNWALKKFFDLTLSKAVEGLIEKTIDSELDNLDQMKGDYQSGLLGDEKKQFFQESVLFANTAPRKKYDQAKIAGMMAFKRDLMQGLLAKHTTDENLIGQQGKECNFQKFIEEFFVFIKDIRKDGKLLLVYLKELENPKRNQDLLEKKREDYCQAQSRLLLNSMRCLKFISSILLSNPHYLDLISVIDNEIIPNLNDKNPHKNLSYWWGGVMSSFDKHLK